MADTAVMSPSASLSRDQTEDVEMADSPAIAASDAQENEESSTPKEPAATSNGPPAAAAPERSRPRINLSTITDVPAAAGSRKASATGERRKGKSIFGLVVGTLNRAKVEDKARMASEKAKKRQEIDARLQAKLAREQTIVRKQDESRKDQIAAKRKLEDMAIKDSIIKNRASVLPDLSNYLLTSDIIPLDVEMDSTEDSTSDSTKNITVYPTTSHPPALFFLPKILTPAQETFLAKRKRRAQELVDADKAEWDAEKQKGLNDVRGLKEAAENAKAEVQAEKSKEGEAAAAHGTENGPPAAAASEDVVVEAAPAAPEVSEPAPQEPAAAAAASPPPAETNAPAESEPQAMEGVDEDAVEY